MNPISEFEEKNYYQELKKLHSHQCQVKLSPLIKSSQLSQHHHNMQNQLNSELKQSFPSFRVFLRDNNSFYRVVYFAYLEMLISLNDNGLALKTLSQKILKGSGYFFSSKSKVEYSQKYKPVIAKFILQIAQCKSQKEALILLQKMVVLDTIFDQVRYIEYNNNACNNFLQGMIMLMRLIVQNLLQNQWDMEIDGKDLQEFFDQKIYKDMSDYVKKAVIPIDSKVQELILYILPRVLRVTIVVRIAKPKSTHQWQRIFPSDPQNTENDGLNFHNKKINLLASSANFQSFDLLYTQQYLAGNAYIPYAIDSSLQAIFKLRQSGQIVEEDKDDEEEEEEKGLLTPQRGQSSNRVPNIADLSSAVKYINQNQQNNHNSDTFRMISPKKCQNMPLQPSRSQRTTPTPQYRKAKSILNIDIEGSQRGPEKLGSNRVPQVIKSNAVTQLSPELQRKKDKEDEKKRRQEYLRELKQNERAAGTGALGDHGGERGIGWLEWLRSFLPSMGRGNRRMLCQESEGRKKRKWKGGDEQGQTGNQSLNFPSNFTARNRHQCLKYQAVSTTPSNISTISSQIQSQNLSPVRAKNNFRTDITDYSGQLYSDMPMGVALWYASLTKSGSNLPHPTIASIANESIQYFTLHPNFAFAITKNQNLYEWGDFLYKYGSNKSPHRTLNFLSSQPARVPQFFKGVKVSSVSCNDTVAHIITEDGTLFSWGNDVQKTGILGLGQGVYDVQRPVPNQSLLQFKMSHVSVGKHHCAATDVHSNLYTWGSGRFGQLGQETINKVFLPSLNDQTKTLKLRQVFCNQNYTALITVGGYLYIFGTLRYYAFPKGTEIQLFIQSHLKYINGISQSYVRQLSGGCNYLTALTNKKELYFIDQNHQVTKLNAKDPIISASCFENKIFGITEDRLLMYQWKLPTDECQSHSIANINSTIPANQIIKIYKLNKRYFCQQKTMFCPDIAQSKGVAALICRVTHDHQPIGEAQRHLLEKDFVPNDFKRLFENESESERKNKFQKAIQRRSSDKKKSRLCFSKRKFSNSSRNSRSIQLDELSCLTSCQGKYGNQLNYLQVQYQQQHQQQQQYPLGSDRSVNSKTLTPSKLQRLIRDISNSQRTQKDFIDNLGELRKSIPSSIENNTTQKPIKKFDKLKSEINKYFPSQAITKQHIAIQSPSANRIQESLKKIRCLNLKALQAPNLEDLISNKKEKRGTDSYFQIATFGGMVERGTCGGNNIQNCIQSIASQSGNNTPRSTSSDPKRILFNSIQTTPKEQQERQVFKVEDEEEKTCSKKKIQAHQPYIQNEFSQPKQSASVATGVRVLDSHRKKPYIQRNSVIDSQNCSSKKGQRRYRQEQEEDASDEQENFIPQSNNDMLLQIDQIAMKKDDYLEQELSNDPINKINTAYYKDDEQETYKLENLLGRTQSDLNTQKLSQAERAVISPDMMPFFSSTQSIIKPLDPQYQIQFSVQSLEFLKYNSQINNQQLDVATRNKTSSRGTTPETVIFQNPYQYPQVQSPDCLLGPKTSSREDISMIEEQQQNQTPYKESFSQTEKTPANSENNLLQIPADGYQIQENSYDVENQSLEKRQNKFSTPMLILDDRMNKDKNIINSIPDKKYYCQESISTTLYYSNQKEELKKNFQDDVQFYEVLEEKNLCEKRDDNFNRKQKEYQEKEEEVFIDKYQSRIGKMGVRILLNLIKRKVSQNFNALLRKVQRMGKKEKKEKKEKKKSFDAFSKPLQTISRIKSKKELQHRMKKWKTFIKAQKIRDKNFTLLISSTLNYKLSKVKQRYFEQIINFCKRVYIEQERKKKALGMFQIILIKRKMKDCVQAFQSNVKFTHMRNQILNSVCLKHQQRSNNLITRQYLQLWKQIDHLESQKIQKQLQVVTQSQNNKKNFHANIFYILQLNIRSKAAWALHNLKLNSISKTNTQKITNKQQKYNLQLKKLGTKSMALFLKPKINSIFSQFIRSIRQSDQVNIPLQKQQNKWCKSSAIYVQTDSPITPQISSKQIQQSEVKIIIKLSPSDSIFNLANQQITQERKASESQEFSLPPLHDLNCINLAQNNIHSQRINSISTIRSDDAKQSHKMSSKFINSYDVENNAPQTGRLNDSIQEDPTAEESLQEEKIIDKRDEFKKQLKPLDIESLNDNDNYKVKQQNRIGDNIQEQPLISLNTQKSDRVDTLSQIPEEQNQNFLPELGTSTQEEKNSERVEQVVDVFQEEEGRKVYPQKKGSKLKIKSPIYCEVALNSSFNKEISNDGQIEMSKATPKTVVLSQTKEQQITSPPSQFQYLQNPQQNLNEFKKAHNFLLSPNHTNERITTFNEFTIQDQENSRNKELLKSPTCKSTWSQLADPHQMTELNNITPRTCQITEEVHTFQESKKSNMQENKQQLQINDKPIIKNRFNRTKFLQALRSSCKKFALQVLARQQFQRQLCKSSAKQSYNRNRTPSVTHSFLNNANLSSFIQSNDRLNISPKYFQKRKNSNNSNLEQCHQYMTPNMSFVSQPSTLNSSKENTPKLNQKHIKTLAPTSSVPKLRKLPNSPNSSFIPQIDLRQNVQRLKTEGDNQDKFNFQSKNFRIFPSPKNQNKRMLSSSSSSTSFLNQSKNSSYAQLNANKKVKPPLGKDLRTIKNLGKSKGCHNKSQSFNNSLTKSKSKTSITTIYLTQDCKYQGNDDDDDGSLSSKVLYQKMKQKYLLNMKIRDKEKDQKNYIQRNILCLKKQDGGQKRIMRCNH